MGGACIVGGTTVGNLQLTSRGALQLRDGSTQLGANSTTLSVGTLYRIGIHQKKGSGANAVLEAYLAVGSAVFGSPFASGTTETFTTQATQFKLGATTATAVDIVVDDIRLDTAAMPAP